MGKNKTNFLIQGSILAIAGVLVRVIGIVYRVPVNNILGEEGITYYGAAFDVYSLFLLISSMSMPIAVSKIVSAKVAKGEIKNAYRAFVGALAIGFVIGTIVFMVVFFGADGFAKVCGYPSAAYAIKVLAPVLFIMSILGVLRGFFQGMGTMIPTAISQVLEQVANAIVSIVGAMYLFKAGKVAGESAALGAAGSTLGTLAGAAVALVFMTFVFIIYLPVIKRQIRRNRGVRPESYDSLGRELLYTIIPVLLSTTIYNLSSIFDSAVFGNISGRVFEMSEAEYSSLYGVYSGIFKLLTTAPIAIASALSSAIIPSIIRSVEQKDTYSTFKKIESSLRLTMIVAIPAGVGLSVLAGPVINLLFNLERFDDAVGIMRFAVITVVVFSMSTLTNAVLQGVGKMKIPVINASVSMVIHYFVLVVLLIAFRPNLYAVVIADIIFGLIVCILNSVAIYTNVGYKQEIVKTFVLPLVAASIMGVIAYATNYLLYSLTESNTISCVFAIGVAIVVYGVSLLLIKGIGEDEIRMLPKGASLVSLLKKMHLL